MNDQSAGRLLTTAEAARRLRVNPSTIRRWRLDGVGPRYLRVNSVYRYPAADLESWIMESLTGTIGS
jgi:excisionase family DNA binding protein